MSTTPADIDSSDVRRRRTSKLWSSDWSLTILLVLLIVNVFALPVALSDSWARLVTRAVLSLIIICGLVATVRSRELVLWGTALTLAGFVISWEDASHPSLHLHLLNDVVSLPLLGILLILISRQIFREGPITMHRVRGSIAVYLLMGVLWTIAYDVTETMKPGSFRFGAGYQGPELPTLGYYSFTTLTTLGFGDILPVRPLARSLTLLEALIGQLYPAVLIARLVSMEITYRRHLTGGEEE
jgi:Ion channel